MNLNKIDSFYSWSILSDMVALKRVDKSAFLHHGTGIPQEIKSHFNLSDGNQRKVQLVYKGMAYNAFFQFDSIARYRLFWRVDFQKLIQAELSDNYHKLTNNIGISNDDAEYIRFETVSDTHYDIEFIHAAMIIMDAQFESQMNPVVSLDDNIDGKPSYSLTIRYERNPKNRFDAIAYHGCRCSICKFDFEKVYGKRGAGFIEVHHIKPLYSTGEVKVNPQTDLIPVCSNCHRMIHKSKDDVLSVEQMKELIKRNRQR